MNASDFLEDLVADEPHHRLGMKDQFVDQVYPILDQHDNSDLASQLRMAVR